MFWLDSILNMTAFNTYFLESNLNMSFITFISIFFSKTVLNTVITNS